MKKIKPTLLVILDGFGYRKDHEYNAIAQANTTNFDHWFNHYPHTLLQASGKAVGLPTGYIGNSEVGHLTIGSGRIIPQPITLILEAIQNGSFFRQEKLISHLQKIAQSKKCLHLMGLLSDAGVHSHEKILYAFLDAAVQNGVTNIAVHPFLDGRDTAPQSAEAYLSNLVEKLEQLGHGRIATIHGRFYAMDRDHNWERTEKSYRILTEKQKPKFDTWQQALHTYYEEGTTDEFIPPTQLDPTHIIQANDSIIFFNTRPDRARQLTQLFVDPNFDAFAKKPLPLLFFVTPTEYDTNLKTTVLFSSPPVKHTLKEILAKNNKTIFTIAETEKYAHVTYFFAGGSESIFPTETRVIIPSIPAKNSATIPAMSASKITETILKSLTKTPKDFYIINYANADMVGHSGDLEATIKAIECLDHELKKLYDAVIEPMDGTIYITADHGNAEIMFDPITNQPSTAHTTSPVPFIMIKKGLTSNELELPLKQLADVAPWILQQMGLSIPKEMHHPW